MMQLCYRLTGARWGNSRVIVDVEGGEKGLEGLCRGRSRVLERGGAIPFCQAGLRQDRWVGEHVDKGLKGLEAAVVGAGEDGVDGRVQGHQVGGQLVGLLDTVGSQGRVGRYARWRFEVGAVLSTRGINQPVGAELHGFAPRCTMLVGSASLARASSTHAVPRYVNNLEWHGAGR